MYNNVVITANKVVCCFSLIGMLSVWNATVHSTIYLVSTYVEPLRIRMQPQYLIYHLFDNLKRSCNNTSITELDIITALDGTTLSD